jgi:general secretion pathway protein H
MKPHPQNGFTLLEMIIVLVILGLILGIAAARGPMHSARLDTEAAARELVGTLRLARGRAIAENRTITVAVGANRYQINGLAAHDLPQDVALAGSAIIRFAPDGSSTGGSIAVQSATSRVTILVNWLTGRVDIAREQ